MKIWKISCNIKIHTANLTKSLAYKQLYYLEVWQSNFHIRTLLQICLTVFSPRSEGLHRRSVSKWYLLVIEFDRPEILCCWQGVKIDCNLSRTLLGGLTKSLYIEYASLEVWQISCERQIHKVKLNYNSTRISGYCFYHINKMRDRGLTKFLPD